MRIAWDTTALELDRGGTARAIEQTIELVAADPRIELLRLQHGGRPPSTRLGELRRGLARELWYLPHVLPRRMIEDQADLLHCPSQLVPKRSPIPLVVTLHDAIGWEHPEWLTRANVHQLHTRIPRALSGEAHVITSSEYSRVRLIEALDLSPERITSVPLGLDSRFSDQPDVGDEARRSALEIDGRYVLTVGTLQPRKNLEAAISAFEQSSIDDHQLVIVGARGWNDAQLLTRIERSSVSERVRVLGRVDDEELIALYRGADCFLFPSLYEGFGFPPLEAMACGTPVLSSTRTSLAEAVGEAAVEIDPEDPTQIAGELDRVLGDTALAEQLIAAGRQQAAKFTWPHCAKQTISVYEKLLGSGSAH